MTAIQRFISPLTVLAAAAALSACVSNGGPVGGYPNQYGYQGQYQGQGGYQGGYQGNNAYSQLGQVTNVEFIRGGQQSDGITGAVIGGAVGGLAGNQVGGGRGRRAATVAGVVGGALIGRALEQNMNNNGGANYDHYRVTVRLDNGAVRQFDYAQPPNVQIGDRVRAEGNQLYR